LKAEIGPLEAIANELNNTITNMERGRATMYEDLTQVIQMASEQVQLSGVSHGGSSLILNGVASNEDAIFNYARNLRGGGRFSTVLISSISQSETGFNFAIHLAK
jgi:Tfp pilus assembly protein PilN